MSTTATFMPEPGATPPWADAAPGATCPAGFDRRTGPGAAGGYPPAIPSRQLIARTLLAVLRQLELCQLLAETDYARSGIDFLLVDVADVLGRCFSEAS
jgi:hypothetical protein